MRKYFLMAAIFLTALQYGCNTTATNPASADSTGGKEKSVTADTAKTTPAVAYDPDPSDTIATASYNPYSYGKNTEELVRTFLQAAYKKDLANGIIDSFSRRFVFFEYDLYGDSSKEIFVGLTGSYFCGSGGCTIVLLNGAGHFITRFTVADKPIIISSKKTNGWNDLIITSGGKQHLVKSNGKYYPSNPSVQPTVAGGADTGVAKALDLTAEAYPWFTF